jgi:hypothetical protein
MLDTEEAYARALGLLIEVENKMKNRLFISWIKINRFSVQKKMVQRFLKLDVYSLKWSFNWKKKNCENTNNKRLSIIYKLFKNGVLKNGPKIRPLF